MKKLYLVTNGYPYTIDESTFIQPEIEYLSDKYKITIIARIPYGGELDSSDEVERIKSKGIAVYKYVTERKSVMGAIKGIFKCTNLEFFREIIRVLRSGNRILARLALIYVHYTEAIDLYYYILKGKIINDDSDSIFYSYWFHQATHAGIILKRRKCGKLKVISRVHGYDLYNEQGIAGYQPFKCQMDLGVDRLLFVCEQGKQYYLDYFATSRDNKKYIVNRLGVYDPGGNRNVIKSSDGILNLVSCSSVYPVKRLYLIIEALALIEDVKVKWVHFGDGADYDCISELASDLLDKKDNIEFMFMGRVVNRKVLEYYKEKKPDCIINTSYSEGCTVSIQEAISYGMLVIATNVGGNGEMVDGNGILLSKDPSPREIAQAVSTIARITSVESEKMKKKSVEIWQNKFNRVKNIVELGRILEELNNNVEGLSP